MATLSDIEKLAKDFSDARLVLKEYLDQLELDLAAIKKKALPEIRRAADRAAERHQRLFAAVQDNSDLFRKPKTYIFHGIRVGYMKSKGEIIWEDTSQVVKLIKRHFPGDWESMIKVVETPIKAALAQLSVGDLKKLGVEVTETGDEVIVKATDSDIDRIVNAILKEDEITIKAA